jgi:pimeloyl-ACP methyl ester carboxylesterase
VTDRFRPEFAWDFAYHACPLLPALLSDVIDELHLLQLPIEVLWGRSDRLLRYRSVAQHLSRLPQARIEVIEDCGHMPNFEQPHLVAHAAQRLAKRVRGE